MRARPVFINQLVFVTRCIDQQRFRLAPSKKRNEIIEYLVAVLSERHNIGVVALTVMSDHYHAIFFDAEANLPKFTAELHALLAKILNWADRNGGGGRLWDGKQTNQLNLNDNEVVLDKLAYVMANPVAAGAVAHGKSWPGIRACWPSKPKVVRRPDFFREIDAAPVPRPKGHRRRKPTQKAVRQAQTKWREADVKFPEFALFETTRPPGFDELDEEALKARIQRVVREREERVRAERKAAGKPGFLGAKACMTIDVESTAQAEHPLFTMTPTFVGVDADARQAELRARNDWLESYRAALERWSAGDHDTPFPLGTYFMRVRCGVRINTVPT